MADYVIIGNSISAVGCIEGIRSVDKEGTITVIGDEKHHVYSRPLISYLLLGKTNKERMLYRQNTFYDDMNVDIMLGIRALKIDTENKAVICDTGEHVPYSKLLIATGSRPFVPPMQGLDKVKNKFSFMTLDDADALDKAITKESRVLIVGAGLIGLKCAEGIYQKVKKITVIDLASRILPSILTQKPSETVRRHIEKTMGVDFILSDSVEIFDECKATTKTGREIGFDVLVIAVGVRANTEIAKEAGIDVNRGILVNKKQETSLSDIYASGDCCEGFDYSSGNNKVLAILPNAYIGGHTAGVNMAGGQVQFDNAIPMNAIGFCGMHIISAGEYPEDADIYETSTENGYKALYSKNNRLAGYILVGDVARAGIYTSLIRDGVALDSINYEKICEKPQLIAFSKPVRQSKLNKTEAKGESL